MLYYLITKENKSNEWVLKYYFQILFWNI
jgi:hypothetical protein